MRIRKNKKERIRIALISMAMFLAVGLLVSTVYGDWQQILKNRKDEVELSLKYEQLMEEEIKINAEILKLGDDEYLARYAKEKFMLSKEGDTIIKLKN